MRPEELYVLIVDDQHTMRSIIRDLLHKLGIKDIGEAEDGEKALDLLRSSETRKPDIIISDLYMEKGGGVDLLNKLRREDVLKDLHIPVILLTGETDEMVLDVTRQVGAAFVLTKPCSVGELGNALTKAVGFTVKPVGFR